MTRTLIRRAMGLITILICVGCASKKQIEQALLDNPDIVFQILEKNPERASTAINRVSLESQQLTNQKADLLKKAQMEEEWRNPKKPTIDLTRPVRGDASSAISIVMYSDFQCPYCAKGHEIVGELSKKYKGKFRFVYKHVPLSGHSLSLPAAKRFEAIALQSQKKAWKFLDQVFENQSKLNQGGIKFLDSAAANVGANLVRMKKDMDSETIHKRIQSDQEEAENFGFRGTPGFIVAGISVFGAQPISSFSEILDRKLTGIIPPLTPPQAREVTSIIPELSERMKALQSK